MRKWLRTSCYAYLASLVCAAQAFGGQGQLHVQLRSASNEYALGEPVILNVQVTNLGEHPIQTWVDVLDYQIEIYIAPFGQSFRQFTTGTFDLYKIERSVETLKPHQSKVYVFRVLYTFYATDTPDRRSGLAFEKPGRYLVKARYPLYPNREFFESNTIEVSIKEPEGVDAKVWKEINSREFLYFLQSGLVLAEHEDLPLRAAKLLQSIPESSYTSALNYSLEKRYHQRRRPHMTRQQAMEDPELKLIRSVTGIEEPPEGPFPDDPRLAVKITYHFAELTPLEEVFKEISKQSRVPLRLAPQLRIQRMKGGPMTRSLRQFMIIVDGERSNWIRDGYGYRLVPAREPI